MLFCRPGRYARARRRAHTATAGSLALGGGGAGGRDEEAEHLDPVLGAVLSALADDLRARFRGPERAFYEREFEFFGKVTAISGTIRPKPLGPERKARPGSRFFSFNFLSQRRRRRRRGFGGRGL